jgi:pumilio RNA-binding family
MMNESGQLVQLPGPADYAGGQMVWAPSKHNAGQNKQPSGDINDLGAARQPESTFKRNALPEGNTIQKNMDAAPRMSAGFDVVSRGPKVGTWFKKLPSVCEEGGDESETGAIPDQIALPEDVQALGDPQKMLTDAEFAASIEDQLDSANVTKRRAINTWLQPAAVDLALSANGTRVIQKAFEMTGGESQINLSRRFHGTVRHLLDSHHGNHVLQKMIEMMPAHGVHFILEELNVFPGGWADIVKHRFGCRVVQRLLEHCDSKFTAPIVAAVVVDIETFSKHPFANYVVQHILEYSHADRKRIVHALIQVGLPTLAQHRVASNTVERAFEHGGHECQLALAEAILSTPNAIVEMGCSRYGSFTVRRMLDVLQEPHHSLAVQQLATAIPSLRSSKHGRHIVARVSAALTKMRASYA